MSQRIRTLTTPLETERFAWLDTIAEPLQAMLHTVFGSSTAGQQAKNMLNGVPMRHRIHPALIILPLGAWTTAGLLDLLDIFTGRLGRSEYRKAADAAVAFGVVGALPAAAAGLADWTDVDGHPRRVGMAHALLNSLAIGLYTTSLGLRLAQRRRAARGTAGIGYAVVMLSGSLGGEMVFNLGVNVTHQPQPGVPDVSFDVLASADLSEGQPVVVNVQQVPVILLRHGGDIFAVDAQCTHAGGPLNEGAFENRTVQCPWHGSIFDLADGHPVQGPATTPLRTFHAIEDGGRIRLTPGNAAQG
ncbi:MAG: Rieske (2Fe-2S) protein [Chloroflexota bacterium]|nr:Rieske (2Fe-2S) protein [Chloroflexota bacterium]